MTATLPTLDAFLTVLADSIGGPWETQRPNGTWDNTTVRRAVAYGIVVTGTATPTQRLGFLRGLLLEGDL
jgi:hypothetical protein